MDTQSNTTPISFTKSNKILQWLPSRGNVIFTVVLVVMMSWMQASGVFATNAASPIAATNINRAIPYQGRLADNVGNPLTATYPMIFRLYSESSGSVPLWEEQWTGPNSVAVSDGLFNVMLGSLTPILQSVLTDNGNLWLGITVGTDDEMQPRVQLGNVPYAVQAQTVAENSVSSAHIVDGSIEYVDFGPDAIPPDVPVGTVISWWRQNANTALPSNEWMVADGSIVNDPSSSLNGIALPNLTNKFIMGVDSSGIGATGGSNALNLSHSHILPSHNHSYSGTSNGGCCAYDGGYYSTNDDSTRYAALVYASSGAWYYRHKHSYSGTTGNWSGNSGTASLPIDNRPAYVGLIYLIKVK